jgi:cell division septum initiation protein DivIVA
MEILGLLDTLESIILDSAKIPFTRRVMVDEEKVLGIIDKMRNVIRGGGDIVRTAITRGRGEHEVVMEEVEGERRPQAESKAVEVLEQAYQMAKEIREGADKYADEVLANLEATSSRILRTIKAGRERLTKTTQAPTSSSSGQAGSEK